MKITMPKLGLTMTEGTLTEWLKREGEALKQGEILFLFESEKSTMEFEAPADGLLASILVPAGTTVACGTPVARLDTANERDVLTPESTMVVTSSNSAMPQPSVESTDTSDAVSQKVELNATPAAKRRARELSVDLIKVNGRGPEGRIQLQDIEDAEEVFAREIILAAPMEATPIARQLAVDLGIDIEHIKGTGRRGQVTREDVVRSVRNRLTQQPLPAPQPGGEMYARSIPLQGVREVIARRMSESAFSAPHVTLHTEADATALVEARQQINQELVGEVKLSFNTLLVALSAKALGENPALNTCLVDDEIRIYDGIHIALAVDTERGLLVPVIRDAGTLDLVTIQHMSDTLVERAIAGNSLPDDLSGGTFTITNLGMFDIDAFTPIINQPQAAILGVGRIMSKPVDVGGVISLRQMMTLSLSFDHRIVDGAPASAILTALETTDRAAICIDRDVGVDVACRPI